MITKEDIEQKNLNAYEGIKTNKAYRFFEGNGISIFKNGLFYEEMYLVLTETFEFETRLGCIDVWDDVLFYSVILSSGELIYPPLNKYDSKYD
jgi:hypothetical protein